MAIEFVCPSCGRVLRLRDEAAGKRGRCPHCKSVITVPESAVSDDDLIEILPGKSPTPKKPPTAPAQPPEPTPSEPPTAREQEPPPPPPLARPAFVDSTGSPQEQFRRDINGAAPNNLLNYGYMVMRAAVARALCSAGLLPSLGIHHRNRYNAFCLADDVLEPFMGFVESKVRDICGG